MKAESNQRIIDDIEKALSKLLHRRVRWRDLLSLLETDAELRQTIVTAIDEEAYKRAGKREAASTGVQPELLSALSTRICNCLAAGGILTKKQLVETSDADLLRLKNFDRACLLEVRRFLAS